MSKIKWDATGERFYEPGVKNGVLYPRTLTGSDVTELNGGYATGVAWNGLTAVTESPSGAEKTALYADDIKYLNLVSNEEFGCSIEAYTYPKEFYVCDGTAAIYTSGNSPVDTGVRLGQQSRKEFGFCYTTTVGNDVDGTDKGYKLHLVYGCLASPSEKGYSTINDSPEAITFSWEVSTTPITVENFKPVACITIDSTTADETKLNNLKDILYGKDAGSGTEATDPRLPLPAEVISMFTAA